MERFKQKLLQVKAQRGFQLIKDVCMNLRLKLTAALTANDSFLFCIPAVRVRGS